MRRVRDAPSPLRTSGATMNPIAAPAGAAPPAQPRRALRSASRAQGEPERRPRLRHSFAWTFAGNVVYAGSQWGLVVVLARLATPGALGTFALALAVTAPVFLLFGLHLRAGQATDAARGFAFADYLGVRLAGMAAALAVVALVAVASGYGAEAAVAVVAVGATKAIEGLSDVHYGALQAHERMRPIAISLMARGVLSLAAFAGALAMGAGLVAAVAALGVAWILVLLAYDVPVTAGVLRATGEPRRPRLGRAGARVVTTCLPLGLVMMMVSLRLNVPRYFIEHWGGAAELGVFAALASLLVAGGLIVTALGQAATPRLAALYHAGSLDSFRGLVGRLLLVALALGGAGVLAATVAGEPLLRLLFGPRYAGRAGVLVLLMAVGLAAHASSVLGFALTAARRFSVQLPVYAATTLSCAVGSLWLVPRHGLAGAALAWGASMMLEVVAIGALLASALRRRAEREKP